MDNKPSISMLTELSTSLRILALFTLITGILYPGFILGIGQWCFPFSANGSLVSHQGIVVGSHWIGQSFTDPHYFWGRPSTTPRVPYNATVSMGANVGPSEALRMQEIIAQLNKLQTVALSPHMPIPFNLVAASGSGLDPDISPSSARYQLYRVAKARRLPIDAVSALVENAIVDRTFNILGEARVNVLQLNLRLDQLAQEQEQHTPTPNTRMLHGTTPQPSHPLKTSAS